MNGNNIIILKNGTAIASTKSQKIHTSAGVIEVASDTEKEWRVYRKDRKEWSVSVTFLVTTAAGIRNVLNVGETYTLVIRDRSNTYSLTGSAICVEATEEFTKGSLVQGSFQFKGSGKLQ